MVFSFLCLLICIVASIRAIPVYSVMESEITRRPESFQRAVFGQFSDPQLLAAHYSILGLVLYSFFSIIFIHYSFEKTQSPEILFIAFFATSSSLEALRLVLPLQWVYEIPSLYLLMASRIILFGRFFGIISLFTASVLAVGLKTQKQGNAIVIIIVTTLIIALGVPVDTESWDSGLNMISGYVSTFRLIEIGVFLITTLSFFIAGWSRSSREFFFIGTGSALAFLGRNILFSTDTWVGLPVGLALLFVGTWLLCTKLHKVYLWL
jgi:hypothetical protein